MIGGLKWWIVALVLVFVLILSMIFFIVSVFILFGYGGGQAAELNYSGTAGTFKFVDGGVCVEDGRPVVRMYSTSSCPHCNWVGGTFDKVALEYVNSDSIVARHWSLDEEDDLLTPGVEGFIPETEREIYLYFNPRRRVPAFVFGCKYFRIGTGFESQKNLTAEETEFRFMIDELLSSSTAEMD